MLLAEAFIDTLYNTLLIYLDLFSVLKYKANCPINKSYQAIFLYYFLTFLHFVSFLGIQLLNLLYVHPFKTSGGIYTFDLHINNLLGPVKKPQEYSCSVRCLLNTKQKSQKVKNLLCITRKREKSLVIWDLDLLHVKYCKSTAYWWFGIFSKRESSAKDLKENSDTVRRSF